MRARRPFAFDPDADAIMPMDDCWLVDPRALAMRIDPTGTAGAFQDSYAAAVDALAEHGFGCVPDPAAGDGGPVALVATCIVYRIDPEQHVRARVQEHELHLRLVGAMARTDGSFVGSELAIALEVADRLGGGDEGRRLRFRAIVCELFMNPTVERDPLAQLASMPRATALDIVETLKATAWADGCLRHAEQRMLERVHQVLELPLELVGALARSTRHVQAGAAGVAVVADAA